LGQKTENFLDLGTGLIVIPADYQEGSSAVVPIYVRTEDEGGNRINDGWFGAAARVAHQVRYLARNWLFDEWRSSELADETVQDMWEIHKDNLGHRPDHQVSVHAKWKALDKSVGDRRIREGLDGELLEHILETLASAPGFDRELEHRDFWNRMEDKLVEMGMADLREILHIALYRGELYLKPKEGEHRNTLSKRFYRALRSAANLL
jgi:hypothetical protein